MKQFFILLQVVVLFYSQVFAQSEPISRIKGEDDYSYKVSPNLVVPNAQISKLNGSTQRIETGNKNILLNAGFEDVSMFTGWITNSVTTTATTYALEGQKAWRLNITAGGGNIIQETAQRIKASADAGKGLVAYAWIKSALTDVQVCAVNNGTEIACADYDGSDVWKKVSVRASFLMPSVGIKIKTRASTGIVYVDDTFVGEYTEVRGAFVSDWIPYTGTFSNVTLGTGGTSFFKYRRNGDSIDISAGFQLGTGGAVTGTIFVPMPPNKSIDYTKVGAFMTVKGSAYAVDTGTNRPSGSTMTADGGHGFYITGSQLGSQGLLWGSGIPFAWANSYSFNIDAVAVPVVGQSSNMLLSEDSGGRQIAFSGYSTINQSITSGVTTTVAINAYEAGKDTAGAFNTGSYTYTIPETGNYRVGGFTSLNSGNGTIITIQANINGADYPLDYRVYPSNVGLSSSGSCDFFLNKGDLVKLTVFAVGTGITLQGNPFWTKLYITKNATPQTIASGEDVWMEAYNTSGQVIPVATNTTITGYTKERDSHNAFNAVTGIYTFPKNGRYMIAAANGYAAENGGYSNIKVTRSGIVRYYGMIGQSNGATKAQVMQGTVVASLSIGDTVEVTTYSGAASPAALNTQTNLNFLNIARIGN